MCRLHQPWRGRSGCWRRPVAPFRSSRTPPMSCAGPSTNSRARVRPASLPTGLPCLPCPACPALPCPALPVGLSACPACLPACPACLPARPHLRPQVKEPELIWVDGVLKLRVYTELAPIAPMAMFENSAKPPPPTSRPLGSPSASPSSSSSARSSSASHSDATSVRSLRRGRKRPQPEPDYIGDGTDRRWGRWPMFPDGMR